MHKVSKASDDYLELSQEGFDVGLVYKHPWIYRALMFGVYRSNFFSRYAALVGRIPTGASVVDICSGDAMLSDALKAKGCTYLGLDINPRFVEWGRREGKDIRLFDARRDEIPEADVICIQSSLYQFYPNERILIDKMLAKAKVKVLVMEPVVNLTKHPIPFLKNLAIRWTRVGGVSFNYRHDVESFGKLGREYGVDPVFIAGGREMLLEIQAKAK